MPRKNPLGMIKDAATETIKHPIGTATRAAGHALDQARGTVGVGKAVAGHVTKGAAGVIASRVSARRGAGPAKPAGGDLRPVENPAPTPAAKTTAQASGAPEEKVTRPPVTDLATKLVKEQAAHQPVSEPEPTPESPIDAAADASHVDATPADVAKRAAKKAPATKTTQKAAQKSTAKKAPAKKAPAKKAAKKSTPSGKLPARKATPPKTAAELLEDPDLPSPVESIGSTGTDRAQG